MPGFTGSRPLSRLLPQVGDTSMFMVGFLGIRHSKMVVAHTFLSPKLSGGAPKRQCRRYSLVSITVSQKLALLLSQTI